MSGQHSKSEFSAEAIARYPDADPFSINTYGDEMQTLMNRKAFDEGRASVSAPATATVTTEWQTIIHLENGSVIGPDDYDLSEQLARQRIVAHKGLPTTVELVTRTVTRSEWQTAE